MPPSVLWLTVQPQELSPFKKFLEFARSSGHSIDIIKSGPASESAGADWFADALRGPIAYILSSSSLFEPSISDSRAHIEQLHEQLKTKKRLLAMGRLANLDEQLFSMLNVKATGWKAWKAGRSDLAVPIPDDVFAEVTEAQAIDVHHISYWPPARPLALIPTDCDLVDEMDLPIELHGRQPTCAVMYWPQSQFQPSALLLNGGFFSKSVFKENASFASRVLKWLEGDLAFGRDAWTDARQYLSDIRIHLYDIVRTKLEEKYQSEWEREGLPEKVRQRAKSHFARSSQTGNLLNYCYSSDYKVIIESPHNWPIFADIFSTKSWLDRLEKINELRLATEGHPERTFERGPDRVSDLDIDFLRETSEFLRSRWEDRVLPVYMKLRLGHVSYSGGS